MTAMYRRDDNTSFAAQLANNNVACRLLLSSNIKVKLITPFLVLFDDPFNSLIIFWRRLSVLWRLPPIELTSCLYLS